MRALIISLSILLTVAAGAGVWLEGRRPVVPNVTAAAVTEPAVPTNVEPAPKPSPTPSQEPPKKIVTKKPASAGGGGSRQRDRQIEPKAAEPAEAAEAKDPEFYKVLNEVLRQDLTIEMRISIAEQEFAKRGIHVPNNHNQ